MLKQSLAGAAPILSMEAVFHTASGSLASGSVALPDGGGREIQFLGTPLDQSLNSVINHAPLGSPLRSSSLAGSDGGDHVTGGVGGGVAPPTGLSKQYGLGMLVQSRLSHHSPGPQVTLVS